MFAISIANGQGGPGGPGGPGGMMGGGMMGGGTPSTACAGADGTQCNKDGSDNWESKSLSYVNGRIEGTITTNLCSNHPYGTSSVMGAMSGGGHSSECTEFTFPEGANYVSTSAIATPLRGSIAYSISGGIKVYGPFEAGFTVGQACDNNLGSCPAGLDVPVCEDVLKAECGVDHVSYGMLLDTCAGHAMPYHYHKDLACDYDANSKGSHSIAVAVALDGRGIYGLWEGNGVAPSDLDACGGHVGDVPAYVEGATTVLPAQTGIYHYHTQENAPYTLGCFGPVTDIDACKALYTECGDDMTQITTINGQITYDLDCPCFRDQHGAVYNSALPDGVTASPTAPTGSTPSPTANSATSCAVRAKSISDLILTNKMIDVTVLSTLLVGWGLCT